MTSDHLPAVEAEASTPPIQRRSLLAVAGLSATSLQLSPLTASADDSNISMTPLNDSIFYLPTSASDVISLPGTLGRILSTTTRKKAGVEIQATFDPHLYELLTLPVLSDETRAVVPCEWAGHQDGTGVVKITQPLSPGKAYTLILGKRILVRFPVDIVDQPTGTQYQVRGKPSDKTSDRAGVKSKTPVWGVSTGASWELIRWGDGFHSWWPNLITVAALGPGATPKDMFVTVELDSRLITSAQLAPRDSSGKVKSATRNGLTTLTWALETPVAAGTYTTATHRPRTLPVQPVRCSMGSTGLRETWDSLRNTSEGPPTYGRTTRIQPVPRLRSWPKPWDEC